MGKDEDEDLPQAVGSISLKELLTKHEAEFHTTQVEPEDIDDQLPPPPPSQDELQKDLVHHFLYGEEDLPWKTYEEIEDDMDDISGDGGVKKYLLKEGHVQATPNSLIIGHYAMFVVGCNTPFDSTYINGKPKRFQLGNGTLLEGFELALASMSATEKAQFVIEPRYGFGEMGVPPRIPPNARILLNIEVVKVTNAPPPENDNDMEDRSNFNKALTKALQLRKQGKLAFHSGHHSMALKLYRDAERVLLWCALLNDEEESEYRKNLYKVYLETAIICNKMDKPGWACKAARNAIECNSKGCQDPKLFYHWGKAHLALTEYTKAKYDFAKVLKLLPSDESTLKHMAVVNEKLSAEKERESSRESEPSFDSFTESRPLPPRDIVTESFKLVVTKELTRFKNSPVQYHKLPLRLTNKELEFCKQAAYALDLSWGEDEEDESFIVTKSLN